MRTTMIEEKTREKEDKRIIKKLTGINMKDIIRTTHMYEEIKGDMNGKTYETIFFKYYENNYFKLKKIESDGTIKKIGVNENGKIDKKWVVG